jgi:hypothetical protein
MVKSGITGGGDSVRVLQRIQHHAGRLQSAAAVLMVRPESFGHNEETAATNAFQHRTTHDEYANDAARREFDALAGALRSEGIAVHVVDDVSPPVRPDAVFPNNWVSFHADGTVVLYPMMAPNRRLERRLDVLEFVAATSGFIERRRLDLTPYEHEGRFLEGTGSLVLDHVHRIAFACRSPRTDASLVEEWAHQMHYRPVIFDAGDAQGRPYYHTNVMMWIGSRCAAVCLEAVATNDRAAVGAQLSAGGREIVELDRRSVAAFAGNMIELASWDEALGDYAVLVMSLQARQALSEGAMQRLSACVDTILVAPVPTIEQLGGGSVRCMMAEVPVVEARS